MFKAIYSVFALSLAIPSIVSAAPRYNITDLGPNFESRNINDLGVAAGTLIIGEICAECSPINHAAYRDENGITDLGTLGGIHSNLVAINNTGLGLGISWLPDYSRHTFITGDNGLVDLSILWGSTSYGLDINDSGTIVGYLQNSSGHNRGFIGDVNGITDIGTLGGSHSKLYAINENGIACGVSELAGPGNRAFVTSESGLVDLGTLPGGNFSSAIDINDAGVVAGNGQSSETNSMAFTGDVNGLIQLGTLGGNGSRSTAINNHGAVVGTSNRVGWGEERAFLWTPEEGMLDLNTLVDDLGGWSYLRLAEDINNQGQIVGSGVWNDGTTRFFLLTEVPNEIPPLSDAGVDQTIHTGLTVSLNGSNSSDPDQNYPLSYSWTILNKPAGSNAVLDDPAIDSPSFVADVEGDYQIQLIVTDSTGVVGNADVVSISTYNSAPIAEAGNDQAIDLLGTVVNLDGSGSYDDDGDALTFSWEILAKPAGSNAVLDDASSVQPQFTADANGDYIVQLIVNDSWVDSAADTIMVSFNNVAPIANPGNSHQVVMGDLVSLDGSLSSDANGDTLTYQWSIVAQPIGSAAVLNTPLNVQTEFVADVAGEYIIELVVNDGIISSAAVNLSIMAITVETAVTETIGSLSEEVASIPLEAFTSDNQQANLTKEISKVLKDIENGDYQKALDKLNKKIASKVDGCASNGEPDPNDKIVDCEAGQDLIAPWIESTQDYLNSLI